MLPPSTSVPGATLDSILGHQVAAGHEDNTQEFVAKTEAILKRYLHRCNFSIVSSPYLGQTFQDMVFATFAEKFGSNGWNEQLPSIRAHLISGCYITHYAFSHVPDLDTRTYVAMYAGLIIAVDDLVTTDPKAANAVKAYSRSLQAKQPHDHKVLQYVDALLSTAHEHFPPIAVDIIFWGTARFMTGCTLESPEESQSQTPSSEAYIFWLRNLTGVPDPFAVMLFHSIPFGAYKDMFPILLDFINFNNDILSFYKEMNDNEENMVTALASVRGESKLAEFEKLAENTSTKYGLCLSLMSDSRSRDAFIAFAQGFITFHLICDRYKLSELDLM